VTPTAGSPEPPQAFVDGLAPLHEVLERPVRPGLELRLVPAPKRMAPWSIAVAAEVVRDDEDVASGRFIVLHDPEGQDGWRGDTRVVAFVEAQVESEMGADPALADVGWSWLTESLDQRHAGYTAVGGTVTRTTSKRFGQLEEQEETCQVEIRASWTALSGAHGLDLGQHLLGWCDLLSSTAGLPPVGVTSLHGR
jgi:hypothetical protein